MPFFLAVTHEPEATAVLLLVLGALVAVSVLFSNFANRLGVPLALLFLILGMLGGSQGPGGVAFDNYGLAVRLGTAALILILFDGGLNTSIGSIKKAALPATLLATVGVAITAGMIALAARLLGMAWPQALLLGAVVSPTDAAAIFAVLKGGNLRLQPRVGHVIEVESCVNDPMAVILTTAMIEFARASPGEAHGAASTLSTLAWEVPLQLAVGAGIGLLIGYIARAALRRTRPSTVGLFPALTLALAFLAFAVATLCRGSGFLAVYVTALVIGNWPALPYRGGLVRVHDALAWLAQIATFLMLGLLVFPSHLPPVAATGLSLGLFLGLLARPLAVFCCLKPLGFSLREIAYIGIVGLRGAVPIILAVFPVLAGVPGAERVFNVVFFIVVVNSLIPGAFIRRATAWLGTGARAEPAPAAALEINTAKRLNGELVSFHIHPTVAVSGATLAEIDLPPAASVMLVVRNDTLLAARGDTRLLEGDHVYIFCQPADRPWVDLLFGCPEDHA